MKLALSLLCLAILGSSVSASDFTLMTVKQPLWLLGDTDDRGIRIVDVPYATMGADPEWRFPAISKPFIPATDGGSWAKPHDINLASLYGIKVTGSYGEKDFEVVIDALKAVVPADYPFTIAQVVEAVTTCVNQMWPAKQLEGTKLVIKVIQPKVEPQR